MRRATYVPITPEVLVWAIRESGYETGEIADGIKVSPQTLAAWMTGREQPRITELRRLSALLKRPDATFFLPAPPPSSLPRVEFRHPLDSTRRSLNPEELRWLRETRRLQKVASWIAQELGEPSPSIPQWSLQTDPEEAGASVRSYLGISAEDQLGWTSSSQALKAWRELIEKSGVFVFLLSLGKDACRGFSLWDERSPVIAVNTAWNHEARIFTLFHEYGHLVTRTNSACLDSWRQALPAQSDAAERWCERFAASALMPWAEVERVLRAELGWRPGKTVETLDVVKSLARRFKTSLRATALRLITRDAATWDLYQQIPSVADHKSGSGGGTGRERHEIREAQFGRRTIRLFVEAVRRDVLTRDDVLSYLDIPDVDLP
jgi:Zn-dependent peptidase ImmA (M78 family)/transcriptional regulator with XRE-family HTH domain